jgi:hypothetical protein
MTPKGKALELFDKYFEVTNNYYEAKQCALIAADNIILANPHSNPFNTDVYSTFTYWAEVEKEIENL